MDKYSIGLVLMLLAPAYLMTYNSTFDLIFPPGRLDRSNWHVVYSHFCGRQCVNGTLVVNESACYGYGCFPCDCESDCVRKGSCCPSKYNNVQDIFDKTQHIDVFNRAECKLFFAGKSYISVSTCPKTWKANAVKQKCENSQLESLASVIPYVDEITGLIFINIYCAMCNGLDLSSNRPDNSHDYHNNKESLHSKRLKPLQTVAKCSSYDSLFHIIDPFEYYTEADGILCLLHFLPNQHVRACHWKAEVLLKTACPGKADETVRDLCHSLPSIPALKTLETKNIFCNACNFPNFILKMGNCSQWAAESTGTRPLMTMLFSSSPGNNGDRTLLDMKLCESQAEFEDKVNCLHVSCPVGKVARNNFTSCETRFEEVRGLSYRINMILIPKENVPVKSLVQFTQSINDMLSQTIPYESFTYSIRETTCRFEGDEIDQQQELEIDGYIRASKDMSRDEFENKTVDLFAHSLAWNISHVEVSSSGVTHYNASLKTVCLGEDTCDLHRRETKSKSCRDPSENWFTDGNVKVSNPDHVIKISALLMCPYVTFSLTDRPVVTKETIKLSVRISDRKVRLIWNPSAMSYEEGKIHLCLGFYKDLVKKLELMEYSEYSPLHRVIVMINYYTDLVCVVVSCILLSASILTYVLFPSLRTLPGLNTLCLCISLLIAQASLLVTSLLGNRGILPAVYCILHGVILHYSWLSSFVWMNTCCIHMYRVFLGNRVGSGPSQFVWYCFHSFGLPSVVVFTVIITNYISTQGKSLGYDEKVCFLDTRTSNLTIILSILVPISISALTNAVLFFLSMREIVSISRMQKEPRRNNGVITYVKLSTVTGIFCFFAAAAVQFSNPILSLIASPFASLQGVFIFLSFTANKRVVNLYRRLFSPTNESTLSPVSFAKVSN